MIGLDANLLVRYLVNDDAERGQAARTLPEGPTGERLGSGALRRSFPAGRLCRLAA